MKSARVNPGVAPGSGVYLGLEQGEIEALHVALAAGVAQGLEIAGVPHLVLVRRFLREVLAASAAASCRSQRHPRAQFSPRGRRTRHNSPDKGAPFPPFPSKVSKSAENFRGKIFLFFFFSFVAKILLHAIHRRHRLSIRKLKAQTARRRGGS